jgi:hypothetical protein
VATQERLPTIDRRIDDVSRLDPFAIQPNALAGDAQIFDVTFVAGA